MASWFDEIFEKSTRFGCRVDRKVFSGRSEYQKVDVFDTEIFGRTLAIDDIFMTSEKDEFYYHEMLVHPALTTCPRIQDVLVIGGGDGGTVREIAKYDEVERILVVEIDPTVVDVCRKHLSSIGTAWDDPRLEVRITDGIEFVKKAQAESFDVILLDGCDPVGPALGLFNEDFYHGVRKLLKKDGAFVLQSESPFLFHDVFMEIQQTLGGIFSRVHPYFGPVPIYMSGYWSWTYAADRVDHLDMIESRVENVEKTCRYYNREIHTASFVLPNELRKEIGR